MSFSKLIESKNKPSVLALKEIAQKKVGLDYFEVSNKQLADSKLFSSINEQEIVEELSQQIDDEKSGNYKVTEKTLIESLDSESPETEDRSTLINKENDGSETKESDSTTFESEAVTSKSSSINNSFSLKNQSKSWSYGPSSLVFSNFSILGLSLIHI